MLLWLVAMLYCGGFSVPMIYETSLITSVAFYSYDRVRDLGCCDKVEMTQVSFMRTWNGVDATRQRLWGSWRHFGSMVEQGPGALFKGI